MKRALVFAGVTALAALLLARSEPQVGIAEWSQPRGRKSATADAEGVDATCSVRPLKLPTGSPASLSCRDARRIVQEVRRKLAQPAQEPKSDGFAEALTGWLDPHGLWSAAPDSPLRTAIRGEAATLLSEIQTEPRSGDECATALRLGSELREWMEVLRTHFNAAKVRDASAGSAFELAAEAIYEDDPVTRPARSLAKDLGRRQRAFARHFAASSAARVAESRLIPQLTSRQWQDAVLAAAVRAYVPQVDPHGQWAPLDEEWSLYAGDFSMDLGPRLWGRMLRTALGVRVLDGPTPPLEAGDLVLEVGGIPTVGLSVEQVEQLSRLEAVGAEPVREVVVLRAGEDRLRKLSVPIEVADSPEPETLPFDVERISYGSGSVAVIRVEDVPDGLGLDLANYIMGARQEAEPLVGVMLDLRGNGGGSIDGAASAIGVFLPGAISFPLRRRGGAVEVQRAWTPSQEARWSGPVAVLVDGYTASAAEMIAGALSVYQRGPVLGSRTFGKGCIQEYFDDRSGVGVLRLTTMLFALPDGRALQGVGLQPDLLLPLPAPRQREASLPAAPSQWTGPDVRSATRPGPPWPAADPLGPCEDATVCRALRRLASRNPPRRALRAQSTMPRRATP
ncbi:MAG: S41 family peptidase [Polyangiaceae bacterium]